MVHHMLGRYGVLLVCLLAFEAPATAQTEADCRARRFDTHRSFSTSSDARTAAYAQTCMIIIWEADYDELVNNRGIGWNDLGYYRDELQGLDRRAEAAIQAIQRSGDQRLLAQGIPAVRKAQRSFREWIVWLESKIEERPPSRAPTVPQYGCPSHAPIPCAGGCCIPSFR